MRQFLLRRFILMLLTMLVVTSLVFVMSHLQGDPRLLYLNEYTTQEQWDEWGLEMGLDRPLLVQYLVWLGKTVQGDLGTSLREQRPVTTAVAERIPASLELALAAWIFAIVVGWPLGVLSAVKRGTFWDLSGRTFALIGQALPPFWLGIMLMLVFAVQLEWLPAGRRGGLDHLILPAVTLGWLAAAGQLRLVRSAMLNTLDSEYIKFARCKGVGRVAVIWKHAMKNATIPPLTYAGLVLASWGAGAVVTATVFAWPGLGSLAIEAVYQNDFPLLVGTILVITFGYVSLNFVVDIAYAFIDPRIRYS
jgi:peptide/nickel transport system permease protein